MHTNNDNTTTTTTNEVSQEINSTRLCGMRDKLTIAQISGAMCSGSNDPVGALRMQNAGSLYWERRKYNAEKAARARHQSTDDWLSEMESPRSKRKSVIRFTEPLPAQQCE
ncbi:hypothetical protein UCDDS831_g04118 [Diplodia seriata]|uniref:Uncharacterized protein n=1 Tax=Diplodia seriata TaxID=420778 RepID=A0A0G2GE28_9PEZI|nr:hypothetical protein UCDDS831_g04118 [Diplodia seriata]